MAAHCTEGGDRSTDRAAFNELPTLLLGSCEKGVRRTPHTQPLFFSFRQYLLRFFEFDTQWLFGIDVFARLQNCQVDLAVHRGNRQVQHQVAVVAGQ